MTHPYVLAEGRRLMKHGGLGQIAQQVMPVPDGTEHAANAAGTASLCGIPREQLKAFPEVVFGVGHPDYKCPTCMEIAGPPPS